MDTRVKIFLSVLALMVFLLLALQTPLLATARGASWWFFTKTIGNLASVGELEVSNSIQDQLQKLQVENIRLQAELADYVKLRQELGAPSYKSLRTIRALVIGKPSNPFGSEVVINRGVKDGITLGSPVVIKGGELIGYISELHERSSICQLLLNPATTTNAHVASVEDSDGLVRGRAHTALLFTTIPRDIPLEVGQNVVTAANADTPEGLRLGTIESIKEEDNEAYKEAVLKLYYDPDKIKAVQVLVAP